MSPQVETMRSIHIAPSAGHASPTSALSELSAPPQCHPGHCRGHPDCAHRLCDGHPDNDSEADFDPAARARFWQTYLGVLMIVVGVGVLWWIR